MLSRYEFPCLLTWVIRLRETEADWCVAFRRAIVKALEKTSSNENEISVAYHSVLVMVSAFP